MVFNHDGYPLAWFPGSSAVSIQDSRTLWEMIWENRMVVGGVAHTHPGSGDPVASEEDRTTFLAIERGLGRLLLWPIVTETHVRYYCRCLWDNNHVYCASTFEGQRHWQDAIDELRRRSWKSTMATQS